MKKIFLVLAFMIAMSSCAFADEARDAMIIYSGTDSFARLLPEERQACMIWVSEGGVMSETCRFAVRTLIAENPNAVTNSQRQALLAAASGVASRSNSQTLPEGQKTEIKNDNTGALIAAGVAAVVLGMVIHNNIGHSHSRHGPPPPPPPMYRPAPPHHHMPPMRR